MSFSCQLTLCREAESEGFLGFVEIDVLLVRIQNRKRGRYSRRRSSQRQQLGHLRSPLCYGKAAVVVEVSDKSLRLWEYVAGD